MSIMKTTVPSSSRVSGKFATGTGLSANGSSLQISHTVKWLIIKGKIKERKGEGIIFGGFLWLVYSVKRRSKRRAHTLCSNNCFKIRLIFFFSPNVAPSDATYSSFIC